jgi:hypothetical protein
MGARRVACQRALGLVLGPPPPLGNPDCTSYVRVPLRTRFPAAIAERRPRVPEKQVEVPNRVIFLG